MADSVVRVRLGEMLVQRGVLAQAALDQALALQRQSPGDRLGAVLVRLGLVSEFSVLDTLREQLGLDIFSDDMHPALSPAIRRFHEAQGVAQGLATRLGFFAWAPEQGADGSSWIAARDPLDSSLRELIETRFCPGQPYRLLLIATRDLERILSEVYRPAAGEGRLQDQDLRRLAEDAPVVELVNGLLARANDYGTSDIHIEPLEYGFHVRYRIDGRLQGTEHYPRERFDAVVSRIKLISGLDISERRLPQDGRFSSRASGVDTDIRVSVIPGVLGESLVLRLLPNTLGTRFSLDSLGFEPDHLATFRSWMIQPDGIILVTGPTGSGKSTTLYAALAACDRQAERILTVEDPVEYQVEGVTQFQVHADIGFTFPAALRAILRHDPDTIMIGEIRDVETARIAVQASLTGHRVLSTLHTNDSATAFLRLADMGVESFLVGATVRGVIAQRLVRRLCRQCSVPMTDLDALPEFVVASLTRHGAADRSKWQFRRAVGCPACNETGYRGRTAIYEMLPATERLRAALARPSASHLDLLATIDPGFRFLRDDGLLKAAAGMTSLEEVFVIAGTHVALEASTSALIKA